MSTNSWEIVPYTRVGKLQFGISQEEARNILGKEALIDFDKDEIILYWRENALQLVFDKDGLSIVSFYPYIENIFIEGKLLNWNKTKPLFKWLLKNDPSVKQGSDMVFLLRTSTTTKTMTKVCRFLEKACGLLTILCCRRLNRNETNEPSVFYYGG